jgi:hypothetical protein
MVKLRHLLVAFAVAGLVVGSASATIIDYGPFGYNIGSVGGASGSDIYAQSFIAPEDNVLVLAGMYLIDGGNDPPEVRIDIWGNDAQGWPDENNIVVAGTVYQQYFPDLTLVTTATNTPLVAGETYWVVINGMIDQTSSGNYGSSWENPGQFPDGKATWSNDMGGSWSNTSGDWAFYVETVPEPAALGLLAVGGLMLLGRRR